MVAGGLSGTLSARADSGFGFEGLNMKIAPWYKVVLLIWLAIALPSLFIGLGFSGGGFEIPDSELYETADIVVWIFAWTLILSPILLLPFGISIKRNVNKDH